MSRERVTCRSLGEGKRNGREGNGDERRWFRSKSKYNLYGAGHGVWTWWFSMNSTAIDRIAAAINQLRPDWPVASLRTLLSTKLAARPWADVAIALTAVATDPTTKTPARVLEDGPWWKASQAATGHSEADHHPSHISPADWCWVCSKAESVHPWSGCDEWRPTAAACDAEFDKWLAAARAGLANRTTTTQRKDSREQAAEA